MSGLHPVSFLTLDDAATQLLTLEITDTDDLSRLRDALTDIAFENRVSLRAQPCVARAARLLGAIINGNCEHAEEAMLEINCAIEQAMQLDDDASGDGAHADSAHADNAHAPSSIGMFPGSNTRAADAERPSVDCLPADADFDLLPEFLNESNEYVAQSEAALLTLESNPGDDEALNTVFRAFHTVKGTASFLGLARIATFAHEAESLLSRVRDKEIAYTYACAELSLRSVDMLTALLAVAGAALTGDGALPIPAGYHELLHALETYDPIAEKKPSPRTTSIAPAAAPAPIERGEAGTDATIRVRTDRLDRLVDMVGELVIAQSLIAGDSAVDVGTAHELRRKISHAGKIVRELQELSMSMRMVPLRATFQKLARVVRDTAAKTGKQVQFVTEGDEVEIDRTLADIVGDPLVHMVRNAVDHGVERPDDRHRVGKSRTGVIKLSAYHASGNVVVELSDDGGGLSRPKLTQKAVEKGLVQADQSLSDSEVFGLIFAPGFSTSEQVTDISGRGVGMDVVRRSIESIRGRIDITSQLGAGTTFFIRLPLTLAVTDGMLVRVGAERFVVPITHMHMSFRPDTSMLSTVVGNGEVVLLRGEVLPIVRLHKLFAVPGAITEPTEGLLMIVGDGHRRTALLVDELLGQQQVVAKPLGAALGKVPGVSGGAILGDGRVGLILDVHETLLLSQHEPYSTSGGAHRSDNHLREIRNVVAA